MRALEFGELRPGIDAAVDYAKTYWESGRAGSHVRNQDSGREQAERFEPHFRALAAKWFRAPNDGAQKG